MLVVDLTRLLEDLVLLMKNSNEYHSSIKLVLNLPPDRVLIESDEEQLKQMTWNLCINGIQAMDKQGTLTITLNEVKGFQHPMFTTARKGLVLQIQDEGRGIDEEKINLIFDPFFTTREEGVGLGLATVKKIVEQLGGHIGLTSRKGQGTVFEVFLPQERSLTNSTKPEKELRQSTAS